MNAVVNDTLTDQELQRLSMLATTEPVALMRTLENILRQPVTVAEVLDPSLITARIDFDSLSRAQAAIDRLEAAGVDEIENHDCRSMRNPSISMRQARDTLEQAMQLAARFDSVRKKGGKTR